MNKNEKCCGIDENKRVKRKEKKLFHVVVNNVNTPLLKRKTKKPFIFFSFNLNYFVKTNLFNLIPSNFKSVIYGVREAKSGY